MNLPDPVNQSQAGQLATLLDPGTDVARLWSPADLAAMLRHQLATPVHIELPSDLPPGAAPATPTFHEIFSHPQPPLPLLTAIKDYAKQQQETREESLPEEIAVVLYYGCIAAALAQHRARITSLSDAQLEQGFHWILGQPWVGFPLTPLFTAALAHLKTPARPSPAP